MTKIFLETGKKTTSEYVFVRTLLSSMGFDKEKYDIECVDGKDNLKNASTQMKKNTIEGGVNLIVFDADTIQNKGGFDKRKAELEQDFDNFDINAKLFLFPNNADDGDFESLLENLVQKNTHQNFFDCYGDYETCLGNLYQSPNRKGKLHTYISAQKDLKTDQRRHLGQGEWLFDDSRFWNLEAEYLSPLIKFFNPTCS